MKKIAFLSFVLSGIVTSGFAQEFYFRAGLGYAFPQAGQYMYDTPIPYDGFPTGYNGTRNNNNAAGTSQTYNIKNASFSSGFQSSIGLGYMFSENIGIQLDASIGLSNTKYTFDDNNFNLNTAASPLLGTISTVQQAKTPVLMMPSLVLQTSRDAPLNAYCRFGLALPLNTKVNQDQILSTNPGTGALDVQEYDWQIKSSFSLGYTAAVGLKYKVSDAVSLWGELSILSMNVNAKEQDLKTILYDGQSQSLSSYTYPQSIKFSKTATVDTTLAQLPTYGQPFSNVGINIGVTITISKHERAKKGDDEYIDKAKPFRRNN